MVLVFYWGGSPPPHSDTPPFFLYLWKNKGNKSLILWLAREKDQDSDGKKSGKKGQKKSEEGEKEKWQKNLIFEQKERRREMQGRAIRRERERRVEKW